MAVDAEAPVDESAVAHADHAINEAIEGSDEGDLTLEGGSDGVAISKNDRSLAEFYRWFKNGRLVIDPEWQRSYIWDRRRASKLIESFLVDIPVPVIYLAKNEVTKYEVIDGVQRLTSIFEFFDGKFKLTSLELVPDANGRAFAELSDVLQHKLEETTLRTFELSPNTSKNLLFIIFERLNTGGVALNEMEIRNCIFRGSLNSLIKRLTEVPEFVQCVSQTGMQRRMLDRALILRFFAFYERGYQKAQAGLKAYLNEFFHYYRNPQAAKLDELEKRFRMAMRASLTVFGDHAFRLRKHDRKKAGEWAGRINASIFQVIAVSFTAYDLHQITQRADAIYEEYLDLIATDELWVECVTKSTGDPTKIRYSFEMWQERLADLMGPVASAEGSRLFSRQLKLEMWQQDRSCALCQQEIKSVIDAAMDHDAHYWRGGLTIPSNARLLHRLCNLKRPN